MPTPTLAPRPPLPPSRRVDLLELPAVVSPGRLLQGHRGAGPTWGDQGTGSSRALTLGHAGQTRCRHARHGTAVGHAGQTRSAGRSWTVTAA